MSIIRIQPLDPRDRTVAEGIHRVQIAAYEQEAKLLGVRHFPPLERTVEDVQAVSQRFFGAVADGSIVGVVSLESNEGPGSFNIASLVVSPQRQREGIGRLLLAAALEECGNAETTVSTGAKNIPALLLYAELGFVECGRYVVGSEQLELVKLCRQRTSG